jgi:hypothetical protein
LRSIKERVRLAWRINGCNKTSQRSLLQDLPVLLQSLQAPREFQALQGLLQGPPKGLLPQEEFLRFLRQHNFRQMLPQRGQRQSLSPRLMLNDTTLQSPRAMMLEARLPATEASPPLLGYRAPSKFLVSLSKVV